MLHDWLRHETLNLKTLVPETLYAVRVKNSDQTKDPNNLLTKDLSPSIRFPGDPLLLGASPRYPLPTKR